MLTVVLLVLAQFVWTLNADILYKRGYKKLAYACLYVVPIHALICLLVQNN